MFVIWSELFIFGLRIVHNFILLVMVYCLLDLRFLFSLYLSCTGLVMAFVNMGF